LGAMLVTRCIGQAASRYFVDGAKDPGRYGRLQS
jgi:hypothetical protein